MQGITLLLALWWCMTLLNMGMSLFNTLPNSKQHVSCSHKIEIIAQKTIVAENANNEIHQNITWQQNRLLDWNDFKAIPNDNWQKVAALTSSAIVYRYHCGDDGQLVYTLTADFKPMQSWVRHFAKTAYYLEHEQQHFNITELYARKLRKALATRTFTCQQTDQFEALIEKYLKEWQAYELTYDFETAFSNKEKEQLKWVVKIKNQLAALHAYRQPEAKLVSN